MGASGGKASSKLPLSLQIRSKNSGLKAKYMFSNKEPCIIYRRVDTKESFVLLENIHIRILCKMKTSQNKS